MMLALRREASKPRSPWFSCNVQLTYTFGLHMQSVGLGRGARSCRRKLGEALRVPPDSRPEYRRWRGRFQRD